MRIKTKVKTILAFGGKKQIDLLDVFNVSSKQAISIKMNRENITLKELIKICDLCGCEIKINDKSTGESILMFNSADIEE